MLGKAQYDYAASVVAGGQGIKKIALLYEDTAYGTSQAAGLRAAARPPAPISCWTRPIPWASPT